MPSSRVGKAARVGRGRAMKFLVTVTTGRAAMRETVAALARHFAEFGHLPADITLLINYDPEYEGTAASGFALPASLAASFGRVLYLGPGDARRAGCWLAGQGVGDLAVRLVTQPTGFGGRKNLALLTALREKVDAVLFWDDDEYPLVWAGNEASPQWYATDVLNAHQQALAAGADVSSGFWSGFVSPVPQDLTHFLSAKTLRALGEALSDGTETFAPDSLLTPGNFVKPAAVPPVNGEIEMVRGGKWVSGGNLGVQAAAIRSGRVPPFYTPPGSRGDDSLLSLRLQKAKVWSVQAGIFHDCFGMYPEVAQGARPSVEKIASLRQPTVENRFAAALEAWLAYAPLFLRFSVPAAEETNRRRMDEALRRVDEGLAAEQPRLAAKIRGGSLAARFRAYSKALAARLGDLETLTEAWPSILDLVPPGSCPLCETTPS